MQQLISLFKQMKVKITRFQWTIIVEKSEQVEKT